MDEKQPAFNPHLALLLGVAAVSTSAVLVKMSSASASVIATYRLLITVLLMTPFIWQRYRYEFKAISLRDWVYCGLAGVFLALHFILWFESLNYTSVASSVVLVALQPIFAFIGTYIFFRETIKMQHILGGLLAVAGSILISWGDFQVSGVALWGNLMAVLAAIMVTVYFMFGQSARKRLSLMTYTYIVYSTAVIALLIYDVIMQLPLLGYPSKDWLLFLIMALIPTLLGHTIFNWVIKWVSTSLVSISILGEPIGASILAYLLLGESIHLSQWIGGSVILCGIYVFLKIPGAVRKAAKSTPHEV